MKPSRRLKVLLTPGNLLALVILVLSALAVWWLQRSTNFNVFSQEGLELLTSSLGWYGPIAYMLLIALAVVVSQLPGVPLAIAAGALWGPLLAGIYSVLGGFTGGMIAYLLGRTLGRSAIKALTGKVITFDTSRGERYLGWIILVSRMLPVLSFDIISYAAGMTGLSVGIYALATLVGMIPSTFLLTYLGSSLTVSPLLALGLSGLVAVLLVALPWLIKRYNFLSLGDIVRME